MYRSYNEDWQRRKAILVRSLFHDVGPLLSPVTEESNETSDEIQSDENYVPPTDRVSRSSSSSRSVSPLPPLIIEKVPYVNKHDEPEEYYQKLLLKMRRIYRKLIIENKDLSSEDYDLIPTSNDYLRQSFESDDINLDVTENHGRDSNDIDTVNDDVREDSESTQSNGYEDAQVTEEDISSDGTDYKQITTKAIVHFDGDQENEQRESQVYEDSVRSIILPTSQFKRANKFRNVNVEDKSDEHVGLEDNEDPIPTRSFDTDESIEAMRTQTKRSQESMPIGHIFSDSESSVTYTPARQELTEVTSSDGNCSNNNVELKTTDAKFIINENMDENAPNLKASGRKRKLYEDISVQTSEKEKVTWDDLRRNFFVGTPKIFKLCSCVHHNCN